MGEGGKAHVGKRGHTWRHPHCNDPLIDLPRVVHPTDRQLHPTGIDTPRRTHLAPVVTLIPFLYGASRVTPVPIDQVAIITPPTVQSPVSTVFNTSTTDVTVALTTNTGSIHEGERYGKIADQTDRLAMESTSTEAARQRKTLSIDEG